MKIFNIIMIFTHLISLQFVQKLEIFIEDRYQKNFHLLESLEPVLYTFVLPFTPPTLLLPPPGTEEKLIFVDGITLGNFNT